MPLPRRKDDGSNGAPVLQTTVYGRGGRSSRGQPTLGRGGRRSQKRVRRGGPIMNGISFFADMPELEPIDASQAIPADEITWERILEEEPEVAKVFAELKSVRKGRRQQRWFRFVDNHGTSPKACLCKLVGWYARNPRLRSQEAYRVVMERMWHLVL